VRSCSSSDSTPKTEQKGHILGVQNLVEKNAPRRAFVLQQPHLAAADVHQQAERQRLVGLACKRFDGLWLAVS